MDVERKRGFEVARGYERTGVKLPIRSTRTSAGFDFEAAEDVYVPPIWKQIIRGARESYGRDDEKMKDFVRPTKVATGIKAYMGDDEFLGLFSRSSLPFTKFLILVDGVGVVDSDYYESEREDGHIFFQFINFGLFPVNIKKGERIGQGVFLKFLDADNGKARKLSTKRTGGSGTT